MRILTIMALSLEIDGIFKNEESLINKQIEEANKNLKEVNKTLNSVKEQIIVALTKNDIEIKRNFTKSADKDEK